MALPLMRRKQQEAAANSPRSFTRGLMYRLTINGDNDSKRAELTVEKNGKLEKISGRYEDVLFLCDLDSVPTMLFHRKKTDRDQPDRILSGSVFGIEDCPVAAYAKSVKDMDQKIRPISGVVTEWKFPVLVYGRQEPRLKTKNGVLSPVMWFEMAACEGFIEEDKANCDRLRMADEKYPLHKYLYRIFAKDREKGKKTEYYFYPVPQKGGTVVYKKDGPSLSKDPIPLVSQTWPKLVKTEHPLLQDWWDGKKWVWDEDYVEMIGALAVVSYQKFVHPSTGETFEYNGHYDEALEIYKQVKDSFPPAAVKDKSDSIAEVEVDEDIPF